jgi:hypothetical protein
MAKQRKGISKALKKGNVESTNKLPENVEPNGLFTGKEGAAISAIVNKGEKPNLSVNEYVSDKKPVDPDTVLGNQGKEVGPNDPKMESQASKLKETINQYNPSNSSYSGSGEKRGDRSRRETEMNMAGVDPTFSGAEGIEATPSQGSVLASTIANDASPSITRNEVLAAAVKNAETPSQLEQAGALADEAKQEAGIMQAKAAEGVSAIQEQLNSGLLSNEPVKQPVDPNTVLGDQGAEVNFGQQAPYPAVAGVVAGAGTEPQTPNVVNTDTKPQIENQVLNAYTNFTDNLPKAVVERLGVQDYFPDVARDIAVGTFSGSRIGSQTIYSGVGGLLPMGLYDARKRALSEAAKEKQKQLDKYFDVIETAPQYQQAFNQATMQFVNESLAGANGNADALLKDPKFRAEYAKRLGTAKDIKFWADWSDQLLKDAAKNENYVNGEAIDMAGQIKSALVDHMDEIVSGKKSLKDFVDIEKAQLYQNIVPQIDKLTKELLDPNRMGKAPINMRTGDAEGRLSPEEFAAQRDEFLMKLKNKTLTKQAYLSGFKKFFTGDYEQVIDGLIDSGKYSEEQRDAALNYFAGQVQEQVELNPEFIDSGQMDAARLAEQRRQFDLTRQDQKDKETTVWTNQNNLMNQKNPATGLSMQDEIDRFKAQGLRGEKLQAAIMNKARQLGFTNAEYDPYLKTVVIKGNASQNEGSNYYSVNAQQQQVGVRVRVRKWNKATKKFYWEPEVIPVSQFVKGKGFGENQSGDYLFEDGTKVTNEDLANWRNAYNKNKIAINATSYESYWGVSDKQTGKQAPVNSGTIGSYGKDKAVNMKNSTGRPAAVNDVLDANGNAVIDPKTGLPAQKKVALRGTITVSSDISDETQRYIEDSKWGNLPDKTMFTRPQDQTGLGSSTSMSYQSQ